MRKLFLVLATLWGLAFTGCSSNGVLIYLGDSDVPIKITNQSQTLSQALASKGLKISEIKNKYQPSIPWDSKLLGNSKVELVEKLKVTLVVKGQKKGTYQTAEPTVAAFLKEQRLNLVQGDHVQVPLNKELKENMVIYVDRTEQKVRKEVIDIPFDVKEEINPQLIAGAKETKVEGKVGKELYQVIEKYFNGKPVLKNGKRVVTRKRISLIKKPVTKIVSVGTNRSFSTLKVSTTAYSYTGSRTATGKKPKKGTIAVDPRVIPLGTRLYIPGYGYGVAEDTGGAIKGRIIDLFFHSRSEAMRWGRRTVTIRIVR